VGFSVKQEESDMTKTENENQVETTGDANQAGTGNAGSVIFNPVPDFIAESKLPASAKLLYGVLLRRSQNGKQPCYAKQIKLAKDIGGVTTRCVNKDLAILKSLGLVTVIQRGKHKSNLYHATPMENADRDAIASWRPNRDQNSSSSQKGSHQNPSSHQKVSGNVHSDSCYDHNSSSGSDQNSSSYPYEKTNRKEKVTDSCLPLSSLRSERGCAADALSTPIEEQLENLSEEENSEATPENPDSLNVIPEIADSAETHAETPESDYEPREESNQGEEPEDDGFGSLGPQGNIEYIHQRICFARHCRRSDRLVMQVAFEAGQYRIASAVRRIRRSRNGCRRIERFMVHVALEAGQNRVSRAVQGGIERDYQRIGFA